MTITAKIIEDSISNAGKRIITYQLSYPRFIHAEAKTHRVISSGDCLVEVLEEVSLMDCKDLSRNASSSRAIPVAKMIDRTMADPAFFVHIGKNQPGMQAKEQVPDDVAAQFKFEWEQLAGVVASYVGRWSNVYGIHKQVANRALEPWQHISVVVTMTEDDNFFELRDHDDAQPEIHVLAQIMKREKALSTPVLRTDNPSFTSSWHLPYVSEEEREQYPTAPGFLAKLSSARCARTSYLTHDGANPVVEKDVKLFEDLVGSEPLHASPTEHQAYPLESATERSKNFLGWRQHREIVESLIYSAKQAA